MNCKDKERAPAPTSATSATVLQNDKYILDEVYDFVNRFVYLPNEHSKVAVTLWIAHTHLINAFYWSPKLMVVSPEKRSGKSRLLEIAELLCQNPFTTFNATPQALWRIINSKERPTILYDETDRLFSKKTQDNLDMIGLINASSKRGAKVYRCDPDNPQDVITLDAFAPIMLAGIAVNMPDTITDRSIILQMERQGKKRAEPYRARHFERVGKDLGERLAKWAVEQIGDRTHTVTVTNEKGETTTVETPYTRLDWASECEPKMPDECIDRRADNWEPLFIVADVADVAHWEARVWDAAKAFISTDKEEDEPSYGVQLLTDIRTIISRLPSSEKHISSNKLLRALIWDIEDSSWNGEENIPRLTQRNLAKRLKRFKVKPKSVRIDETYTDFERDVNRPNTYWTQVTKTRNVVLRGYDLEEFRIAFRKWLDDEPEPPPEDKDEPLYTDEEMLEMLEEEARELDEEEQEEVIPSPTPKVKVKPLPRTPSDDAWDAALQEYRDHPERFDAVMKPTLQKEYLDFMNRPVDKHERYYK